MGFLSSKPVNTREKYNKNHSKKEMFAIGVSFDNGDTNTDVRTHIEYASTTVKKYSKIEITKLSQPLGTPQILTITESPTENRGGIK